MTIVPEILTLIIPTYTRTEFLTRILRYYWEKGFPHQIFIADSSSEPVRAANQEVVASMRDILNIRYEPYLPDISFPAKIANSLNTLESKYVAFCADDDFLIPKGLEACLQYLEDHPDYSAAQGRRLIFKIIQNSALTRGWSFKIVNAERGQNLSQDRAIDRLYQHLSDYASTFYAVHRRIELLRNLKMAGDRTRDLRFGELLPSCLTVIQGKVNRLDVPYTLSEAHQENTNRKIVNWGDLLVGDDFSDRYTAFRDCLVREIVERTGEYEATAKEAVNKAALAYFGMVYGMYRVPNYNEVIQWLPFIEIATLASQFSSYASSQILLRRHTYVYRSEISTVKQHVLRHVKT